MQVPSGLLADRFGPRRLFAIGTVATNLLTILFALSGGYLMAVATQAASGFTRSLAFAPGMVLTSTWFPGRRATAMGLFVAGGTTWTLLFGLVGPTALAVADWRIVVATVGAIGLACAVAFALRSRDGPVAGGAPGRAAAVRLVDLMRRPIMWLIALVQAVRLGIVQGIAIWLPTYLTDEHELSLVVVGLIVAAMALLTAPSNLGGGLVADRTGRPFLVIGLCLLVLAGALTLLAAAPGLAGILLAVGLIAVCQQLYFGPLFAAPVAVFGQASAGVVSGAGNLFANLGGFLAVLGLGIARDATGSLAPGFLGLAVSGLVASAATVVLARLVRSTGPEGTGTIGSPA